MSRNQFFYKRLVKANKEGEEDKYVYDSFNMDLVIRGVWMSDDTFTLLLADGHEDATVESIPKIKGGKIVGVDQRRGPKEYLQSQIPLDKEDAERFRAASEIWSPLSLADSKACKETGVVLESNKLDV